jgi:hypothetical protein
VVAPGDRCTTRISKINDAKPRSRLNFDHNEINSSPSSLPRLIAASTVTGIPSDRVAVRKSFGRITYVDSRRRFCENRVSHRNYSSRKWWKWWPLLMAAGLHRLDSRVVAKQHRSSPSTPQTIFRYPFRGLSEYDLCQTENNHPDMRPTSPPRTFKAWPKRIRGQADAISLIVVCSGVR